MTFCFHRWSRWKTVGTYRESDFGTEGFFQVKECVHCGKAKTRYT